MGRGVVPPTPLRGGEACFFRSGLFLSWRRGGGKKGRREGFFLEVRLEGTAGLFLDLSFSFPGGGKGGGKGGMRKNQHEKGVCLRGDFRGRCKLSLELEQDFPFKKEKTHLQKPTMGCKVTLLWLLLQL